jgi:hypothetical protein
VISSHLLHVFNSTTSYIRAHIVPLYVSRGCRHTISIGLISLNMVHAYMICNKEQLGHLGTSHIIPFSEDLRPGHSRAHSKTSWPQSVPRATSDMLSFIWIQVLRAPFPLLCRPLPIVPVSVSLGFFDGKLRPRLVQEYCISVTLCCPTMMICRSWCLVQRWQGFLVKKSLR